jgi:ketosteroid isomerase-like protein
MKSIDVMRDYLDAYFKGDLDVITSFLAEDFKIVQSEGMPYAGEWVGKKGFTQLIDKFYSYWADAKIEITNIIGDPEGDNFAVTMNMTAKSVRSGRPFATSICEVWTVKDGKLAMVRPYYWDTKLMSEIAFG